MKRHVYIIYAIICILLTPTLNAQFDIGQFYRMKQQEKIVVGANQTNEYLPLLKNRNVGLIVNHTSMVDDCHLVDTLLSQNINIQLVFAPEHGFRGTADAGEKIENEMDHATGIQLVSLYGKNKAPSSEQLANIDVLVFDIQDVGARFYTYISTMYLAMKSAALNNVEFIVLDRPNPNGHYIDGPVLDAKFKSFVGQLPLPVVHGLTVGELAKMIVGENWITTENENFLSVIQCQNYDHNTYYNLPIAPSPNLQTMSSVYLYPSLCFFEGTVFSVGRGTDHPLVDLSFVLRL